MSIHISSLILIQTFLILQTGFASITIDPSTLAFLSKQGHQIDYWNVDFFKV